MSKNKNENTLKILKKYTKKVLQNPKKVVKYILSGGKWSEMVKSGAKLQNPNRKLMKKDGR